MALFSLSAHDGLERLFRNIYFGNILGFAMPNVAQTDCLIFDLEA